MKKIQYGIAIDFFSAVLISYQTIESQFFLGKATKGTENPHKESKCGHFQMSFMDHSLIVELIRLEDNPRRALSIWD